MDSEPQRVDAIVLPLCYGVAMAALFLVIVWPWVMSQPWAAEASYEFEHSMTEPLFAIVMMAGATSEMRRAMLRPIKRFPLDLFFAIGFVWLFAFMVLSQGMRIVNGTLMTALFAPSLIARLIGFLPEKGGGSSTTRPPPASGKGPWG